ncbi:MAG: cellulase family glycosylhydrolase [Candidatus Nanopelagicales bacterium]
MYRLTSLLGVLLTVILVSACGTTRSSTPAEFGPPEIRGVAYHGVWTSRDDADRAAILDAIADAGIPWVRLDVGWQNLQPDSAREFDAAEVARLDERLHEISDRGLRALVMFWWAPPWSSGTGNKNGVPGNPEDYASAAAWLVAKWPTQIAALQVWNEPNLPEFFASTDPAEYAELLKATYPVVKQVRPDLTVVTAGPANLDRRWYRSFYDLDVANSFDALGAHPYPVRADTSPAQCRKSADSGCDMSWLAGFLARRGEPERSIWVTEFGWSVHPNSPDTPGWQRGVTLYEQAAYTAQMLAQFATIRQVEAVFVYRDRDFLDSDIHSNGWGILGYDNHPKPVYDVVTCSSASRCRELAREVFSKQR